MTPQERLTVALDRIPDSVGEMRDALRFINDAPDMEPLLDAMAQLSRIHASEPDHGLAREFAVLRGGLGQVMLDPAQHDLAAERWRALRGARGNLYADLDEVLAAASAIGIRPDETSLRLPDSEVMSRQSQEGRLAALETRLRAVTEMLEERIAPEGLPGAGRGGAQLVQVHQYLMLMRRNIRLFNMTMNVGDLIDLAALERVVTAIGRITHSFYTTVMSAASRATQALRIAADRIRKPVRRLATGLATIFKATIRSGRKEIAAQEASEPAPSVDPDAACAMILNGQPPPAEWVPGIIELDFSGRGLKDLSPLSNLTFLRRLDLTGTQITDVEPLRGLRALRELSLANTRVMDIAPLSGLHDLEVLDVWASEVEDLSAVAGLKSLRRLVVWDTKISEISAVALLPALEHLDIWSTNVTDLTPLAGLASLRSLAVGNEQVGELSAIAGLTGLTSLWLIGMKVRDIGPLSNLTALETLGLSFTGVSDLTPLAGLKALKTIDLKNTQVRDLSPLKSLPALEKIVVESVSRRRTLVRSFNRPALLVVAGE